VQLTHTVEIAATPAVVWAANEDVELWPELSPSMDRVERLDEGELVLGSRARIKQPRMPSAVWEVVELERGVSFRWESRQMGIRMAAVHELESNGAGGTTLTLIVEMAGLPVLLMGWLIRRMARRSMEQEAAGFKAYCEGKVMTS
jgi:carbon monoxide dehydrogenase subunit G